MSALTCVDCGKETDPYRHDTMYEITGWIKYRGAKGGANHVVDQRKTGRLLCANCALRRRLKLPHEGQGSLL